MNSGSDSDREEPARDRARRTPASKPSGRGPAAPSPRGPDPFPEFVGDGDGGDGAAAAEPPLRWARAPTAEEPAFEPDEDEGPCFASRYLADDDEEDDDSLGGSEFKHAFKQLHEIVDALFGSNTSTKDVVDAVHAFYEKNIRSQYDYGVWSRKSIYRYIMYHSDKAPERQVRRNIGFLQENIEFLRESTALVNDANGETKPDVRHIREMATLIKLHSSIISDQKKRLAIK